MLHEALGSSQRLGMLGDRPLDGVIDQALQFVEAVAPVAHYDGCPVVDLGSGGGVPGLVVAVALPQVQLTMVDRRARRTDHLHRLVGRLNLADRVRVLCADIAELTDVPGWRHTQVAATARGLGSPATTVTLAAPLLMSGGRLVVSEPPLPSQNRWPESLLRDAGLSAVSDPPMGVAVFERR